MASLRRSKIFTPDAQTLRFLYLILKQLDLKTVNWQDVADNIGIKNGHAARMRWSRFKQQAEGMPTQPKPPKTKKNDCDKTKEKRDMEDEGKADADRNEKRMKIEHGAPMSTGYPIYSPYPPISFSIPAQIKPEPSVKQEPVVGFPQGFNSSICLPSMPILWQPQPSSFISTPPLPMHEGHQMPLPFATRHDDNIGDIPIKQLNSNNQATASMTDLQLSRPIKSEPGERTEDCSVTTLALPTNEQLSTDYKQAPFLMPSSVNQQSHIMQQQSPRPESGRLEDAADILRTASASPSRRESTSIPHQTPAGITISNGSSSPGNLSGYSEQPSYRPPYPQSSQAQHGHYPPHPLAFHHRPVETPFGTVELHANQVAPSSPDLSSQYATPIHTAFQVGPFGPQQANDFQAAFSDPASRVPPQTQVIDHQNITLQHNQDKIRTPTPASPRKSSTTISAQEQNRSIPVTSTDILKAAQAERFSSTPVKETAATADPQCLLPTKSTSPAMITTTTCPPLNICHTSYTTKANSDTTDDWLLPFPQQQLGPQPLTSARQQEQNLHVSESPRLLRSQDHTKSYLNGSICAPWWIQPQPESQYKPQQFHQLPFARPIQINPFTDSMKNTGIPSHHQHYQHQHNTPGLGRDSNTNGNPITSATTGTSSPFTLPFHGENREALLPNNEFAQGNSLDENCARQLDLPKDSSMTLPMQSPMNLPLNVPVEPQFLIPSHPRDSEER